MNDSITDTSTTRRDAALLMSIQPEWFAKIADGSKIWEVRRTMPRYFSPVNEVVFYESGKSARICGIAKVAAWVRGPAAIIWEDVGSDQGKYRCAASAEALQRAQRLLARGGQLRRLGMSFAELELYLKGARSPGAILLEDVKLLDIPVGAVLDRFPDFRAPQSWQYVGKGFAAWAGSHTSASIPGKHRFHLEFTDDGGDTWTRTGETFPTHAKAVLGRVRAQKMAPDGREYYVTMGEEAVATCGEARRGGQGLVDSPAYYRELEPYAERLEALEDPQDVAAFFRNVAAEAVPALLKRVDAGRRLDVVHRTVDAIVLAIHEGECPELRAALRWALDGEVDPVRYTRAVLEKHSPKGAGDPRLETLPTSRHGGPVPNGAPEIKPAGYRVEKSEDQGTTWRETGFSSESVIEATETCRRMIDNAPSGWSYRVAPIAPVLDTSGRLGQHSDGAVLNRKLFGPCIGETHTERVLGEVEALIAQAQGIESRSIDYETILDEAHLMTSMLRGAWAHYRRTADADDVRQAEAADQVVAGLTASPLPDGFTLDDGLAQLETLVRLGFGGDVLLSGLPEPPRRFTYIRSSEGSAWLGPIELDDVEDEDRLTADELAERGWQVCVMEATWRPVMFPVDPVGDPAPEIAIMGLHRHPVIGDLMAQGQSDTPSGDGE